MTSQHRQSLLSVPVFNSEGQPSVRYVDAAIFKLWRHWVESNHGFQVMDATNFVWVPLAEERRHDQLFSHCVEREEVTRLSFESFNERTHTTEHRARFVPTDEMEKVEKILTQHFGGKDIFVSIEAEPGYAITTRSQTTLSYMASNWSMPRGFAPARSAIRS